MARHAFISVGHWGAVHLPTVLALRRQLVVANNDGVVRLGVLVHHRTSAHGGPVACAQIVTLPPRRRQALDRGFGLHNVQRPLAFRAGVGLNPFRVSAYIGSCG